MQLCASDNQEDSMTASVRHMWATNTEHCTDALHACIFLQFVPASPLMPLPLLPGSAMLTSAAVAHHAFLTC